MHPITPSIPSDIFAKLLMTADTRTIRQWELVCKDWSLKIRGSNQLWQILIGRDFKITPGKYVNLQMSREEYKFLFQLMKKTLREGGTRAGHFFTPGKNEYYSFPQLCVDAQERAFIAGSAKSECCAPESALPLLPGDFVNSKSNHLLVRLNNGSYQFLDANLMPITTIRTDEKIETFVVLEEGFLTGNNLGSVKLWDFNGDLLAEVTQLNGHIFDLFSIQLCEEKPAILAWHTTPKENSSQKTGLFSPHILSAFGLDGSPLKRINLDKINSTLVYQVKRIDEEHFAILLQLPSMLNSAFIFSINGDTIPLLLDSYIRDIAVDNGKVYILVEDNPTDGFERSIHVCGASGQYFGRNICSVNKIDVFNDKIYFRNAYSHEVEVRDLSFLPQDDKAWHLDLNNFKLFPDNDKNQIFGIFYCLIKPTLNNGEDYFGCAQHAFDGIHGFTGRFNDSLRKDAITAHLLLNELSTAIAGQNADGAIRCFDRLPKEIQGSLGWGIWIFEGMPMGNPNFGPDFFHEHPTHSSVNLSLQCFRENGWSVLPYALQQEIRSAKASLNQASLTQEAAVLCLRKLSPQACAILKKCIEVLEGAPMEHLDLLARYSSDAYKNGVNENDSIIRAINNLLDKL